MNVGKSSDEGDDRIVHPLRRMLVERVQCDEKWQCPNLQNYRCGDTAIDDLTEVASGKERKSTDNGRWDAEKVRLRRVEAKVPQ